MRHSHVSATSRAFYPSKITRGRGLALAKKGLAQCQLFFLERPLAAIWKGREKADRQSGRLRRSQLFNNNNSSN